AATTWAGGIVHVTAVQLDGSLAYKRWDGSHWLPSATGWTPLGALPDRFVTAPSAASWGANRLDVICVDATGTAQHKWLDGTTWHPSATTYENMGSWSGSRATLVSPASARLDIVFAGGDGALYWKTFGGTSWAPSLGSWSALRRPLIGP